MLRYLRENADSFFSKALLFALAAVFVFFFGSGALTSQRSQMVAEVNGEAIREQELNRVLRQQLRFQQRFNPNMTDADRLRVRQQVMDGLIEQRLMIQAARELGLLVSPKELRRAVIENPGFQDDEGNFDQKAYAEYIQDNRAEQRLQQQLREGLLVDAVQDVVRASVQVSETEITEEYVKANSKRNVSFLKVNTGSFAADVEADEGAVNAWASEHDAEIQERYDRDFERKYNTPKKVSAQHILLKFDESDDEETRAAIRTQMEAILAEAKADGADFGELAKKYSEDSSAPRGGDLGAPFDAKRMVKPFSDAAFDMDAGAISGIVETRYGLHIIQVNEVFPAETQALADARLEVASELFKESQAPELAREFAQKLIGALDGTLDAEAAAELLASQNLTIQETGEFDRQSRTVPKLGRAPEVLSAAFAMTEPGSVTKSPVELPTGFVVFKLVAATEADMAALADEKDAIRDRLVRTKQARSLEAWRNSLKEAASIRVPAGA